LQSLKKEGARDRHFRTLIYLHVVRNWAWRSRSRSHRELLLRPVGGQLFWFRRPPHRSYRVDRPASPAAAARSGGPGASQPQIPRKNPRLARKLFRWLTALAHSWRLEQDEGVRDLLALLYVRFGILDRHAAADPVEETARL
jgi:hypothetical protein